MNSANIKKGFETNLVIESLIFGGKGLAHLNDLVVFVKNTIPGQVVRAKIFKKNKKYLEAYPIEIIKESKNFVKPQCNFFQVCGGCSYQNLDYNEQIKEKQNQINAIFSRIGKIDTPKIEDFITCDEQYHYRNKMEFTFSNSPWKWELDDGKENFALGLHVPKRFDKILNIDNCKIHNDLGNDILRDIHSICKKNNLTPYNHINHTGFLRNLMIRHSKYFNEFMINIITSYKAPKSLSPITNHLNKKYPNITSIINNINTRKGGSHSNEEIVLFGNPYLREKIGDYLFEFSSNSFFQTNSLQTFKLYETIKSLSGISEDTVIYDLFCGTGSIAIYLSNNCSNIIGIDNNVSSIKNAQKNAKLNNIDNIKFILADLNKSFKSIINENNIPEPDLIILDPPRPGLNPKTIKNIIDFNPHKIIYVSCNPSTQARDINELMNSGYLVDTIQPIDMFPHTPHIESIIKLIRTN